MNRKSLWQVAPILATTLTLSALVGCSSTPTSGRPISTPAGTRTTASTPFAQGMFFCVQDRQKGWVTYAQRNNLRTMKPLLVWQTTEFEENWPAEKRCNHVADKLNQAVEQNGGYLTNLALSYGQIGNQTVVCLVTFYTTCNANNMLFTLKPENAQQPQEVLAKIAGFSKNKWTDTTMNNNDRLQYLLLDDLVNFGRPYLN